VIVTVEGNKLQPCSRLHRTEMMNEGTDDGFVSSRGDSPAIRRPNMEFYAGHVSPDETPQG
jgi:hypothetical protein